MSESREAARERARELRAAHRKRDRRRQATVILSIIGGVLVAAAWVAVGMISNRSPRRDP